MADSTIYSCIYFNSIIRRRLIPVATNPVVPAVAEAIYSRFAPLARIPFFRGRFARVTTLLKLADLLEEQHADVSPRTLLYISRDDTLVPRRRRFGRNGTLTAPNGERARRCSPPDGAGDLKSESSLTEKSKTLFPPLFLSLPLIEKHSSVIYMRENINMYNKNSMIKYNLYIYIYARKERFCCGI